MNPLACFHGKYVHQRRVRVLCTHLSNLMPSNARVLDVGSGDGLLAYLIAQERPDLSLQGIDIFVREKTHILVSGFDGQVLPFKDDSFDVVMFVDVLHHTRDPMILLGEARRVARQSIVIKDHTLNGFFAGATLRCMDWGGNARHGVALFYNYWSKKKWFEAFGILEMKVSLWDAKLGLYPWPASWVFDRRLHFVARLDLSQIAYYSQPARAQSSRVERTVEAS